MSGAETKNDNSAKGGAYGAYGPLSPAHGYGPKTDDPVSYQRYFTRIANPGPTGMWAFAVTVLGWSFYVVGTRSIQGDRAIVGAGLFVGGLAQFLAGMWEFPRGNVFGSAFFTLYGSFWIAYASSIVVLGTDAFEADSNTQQDGLGLYLIIWFVLTCFFFFSVLRRNIAFSILLFFWGMTYLLLAISFWSNRHGQNCRDAGGAFGFVTSFVAFYIGLSELHDAEYTLFRMPTGRLGSAADNA